MYVHASQITNNWTICKTVFSGCNQKKHQAPHYWPFGEGIRLDIPRKKASYGNAFPCHTKYVMKYTEHRYINKAMISAINYHQLW